MVSESPRPRGPINSNTLRILAVLWAWRWCIASGAIVSVLVAIGYLAVQPRRYQADVVLEAPTVELAEVAKALMEFGALPTALSDGATFEIAVKRRVVRLVATSAVPLVAVTSCEQVAGWFLRELHEPIIAGISRPDEAREAERRIVTDPPALQQYWTARALMAADRRQGEARRFFTVVRRSEARIVPKPWRYITVTAALTGLALGACLALTVTWWQEQMEASS